VSNTDENAEQDQRKLKKVQLGIAVQYSHRAFASSLKLRRLSESKDGMDIRKQEINHSDQIE
jgi:hypothetical protein